MILRDYQLAAIEAIRAELRAGRRRVVLVAACGSGKTTCAAAMIASAVSRGKRVLFLAHRRELITQCSDRLASAGVAHAIIAAGLPGDLSAHVQVASVQTLVRRTCPPAELVFVDEAHHARAATYERILAHYPHAAVIGLTATPWRIDGKGLGDLFQASVVAATPAELIASGSLVPYRGFAYDVPDMTGSRVRMGEYSQADVKRAGTQILGGIVPRYLEHASGKRALVFAASVQHSQQIAADFNAHGVHAMHVDADTPAEIRDNAIRRFADGRVLVLSNVGLFTEGTDIPAAEVCILARPTASLSLHLQMVGRVMRPAPGKTHARIHDHAGNCLRHGLPDAERDYSLESRDRKQSPAVPRRCGVCFAIGACDCPVDPIAATARVPKETDGDVVELSELAAPHRPKQRELMREARRMVAGGATREHVLAWLQQAGRIAGYKPGWAHYAAANIRYG